MAFSTSTAWMVMNGGSDGTTGFGGGFDAGQTAGMATDGAATVATSSTPNFTSASYNFVTGDTGAWLFIASGTNWIAGWYKITWDGANGANLSAAAGTATLLDYGLNTATGCATTASPTGATWSIDYSRQTTAQFTYADLTAAGAGSTFTSASHPFGVQQVGNIIAVSAGTNCTVQRVAIASVSVITATFDKAVTTGVTSNGAGKLGASLATQGFASGLQVASNVTWLQYNATAYSSTSTTASIANGRFVFVAASAASPGLLRGFDVTPGDETTNRPTLKWGVNASSNPLVAFTNFNKLENVILDGNRANFSLTRGINCATATNIVIRRVKFTSFLAGGINVGGATSPTLIDCEFTDCTTTDIVGVSNATLVDMYGVVFHDNVAVNCVSITTGRCEMTKCLFDTTTTSGVAINITGAGYINCTDTTIYNMPGDGVAISATAADCFFLNTYVQGCTGWGWNLSANQPLGYLINCGGQGNSLGNYQTSAIPSLNVLNFQSPNADAFIDGPNQNFQPNTTTGAGTVLRSTAFPGTFAGGVITSFDDIGAIRHQDPAGGGTNVFIHTE